MPKKKTANRAEQLVYQALVRAINHDKLRIYLDYGKINRPQSPVYNPWEILLPILAPMLLGIALMWWTGVLFSLLFIIGMILIYSNVVKRKLNALLIQRTKDFITSGYDNCCTLWEFGGLVLVNTENKKIGCVAPEGDWKEFVVTNFSDFMIEKSSENKDNETVQA